MNHTLYVGSDHGGFERKEQLKAWLTELGYQVIDKGAFQLDPTDDYPDFAFEVAHQVVADFTSRGVLLCRSGGGMAITANRVAGIRAVEGYSEDSVQHGRQDNDANILTLASDWLSLDQMKRFIQIFLETPFSHQERHQRRIHKLERTSL